MSDDLSDEAFKEWYKEHPIRSGYPPKYNALDTWQECRRRAEARIKVLEQEIEDLSIWIKEQGIE